LSVFPFNVLSTEAVQIPAKINLSGARPIEHWERKQRRWLVIKSHDLLNFIDDRRVGGGKISLLAGVARKVIEFNPGPAAKNPLPNALPIPHPDSLLTTIAIEVPEQVFVPGLTTTTGESGKEGAPIAWVRVFSASEIGQRWQQIIEGGRQTGRSAGGDTARPAGDEWNTDSALVDASFQPT
jgi:hypothetical protein